MLSYLSVARENDWLQKGTTDKKVAKERALTALATSSERKGTRNNNQSSVNCNESVSVPLLLTLNATCYAPAGGNYENELQLPRDDLDEGRELLIPRETIGTLVYPALSHFRRIIAIVRATRD